VTELKKSINVHNQNNNDTQSITITVEKMSFQGLSEDADADGCVTKLGGRAFQNNGLDEENARGPNVDVYVRGTNNLCRSAERKCVRPATAESGVQNLMR